MIVSEKIVRNLLCCITAIWGWGMMAQQAVAFPLPQDLPEIQMQRDAAESSSDNQEIIAIESHSEESDRLPQSDEYRLGVGDVLNISVWRDDALTRQLTILPDGSISFPLVGRCRASGLTLTELKQVLVDKLQEFIPEPVLSVEVLKPNSLMIYVLGKVNRPGRFELFDRIDVLQALSLAGGLNTFAKSRKIRIFRKNGSETKLFLFDFDQVSRGKKMEQNLLLQRGDVVVVP